VINFELLWAHLNYKLRRIDRRSHSSYGESNEVDFLGQDRNRRGDYRHRVVTFGGATLLCEQAACEQTAEQGRKLTVLCRIVAFSETETRPARLRERTVARVKHPMTAVVSKD
jgi:hypothetical protein